jgi:hypothetical protein
MSFTGGNYQKTPVGQSVPRSSRQAVETAMHKLGRRLPCSVVGVNGPIVTVKFEINDPSITLPSVTMPTVGHEYARAPIQIGCKGYTQAADAYLGGMSGLGGGVATMRQPHNMESLVFVPVGNSTWFPVNGNVYTVYGPGGVTLMDEAMTTFFELTPGQVEMTAGGHTITISSAGIVLDGINWLDHVHRGVQPGSGETSAPSNP